MNIDILLEALKAENDLVSSLYDKKQLEAKDAIIDEIEAIIDELKGVLNKTKVIGLYSCYINEVLYLTVKPHDKSEEDPYLNYRLSNDKIYLDRKDLRLRSIECLHETLADMQKYYRPRFYQYVEQYIKDYNACIEKKKAFLAK